MNNEMNQTIEQNKPDSNNQPTSNASCLMPDGCSVKTIIFDWGGVLIDPPAANIINYCSRVTGISGEDFMNAYRQIEFDFYRGTISEPQLWQHICSVNGIDTPAECLNEGRSKWLMAFDTAYKPRPEMFKIIADLKNNGYKIGLLSNAELPVLTYFEEEIYEDFDFSVFSCIEQMAKPDAEIYHLAAEKAQMPAEKCLFVDDKEENTNAAEKIGMKAIHFKNFDDFKEKLLLLCQI
ncbi:MAG: HAD family hydrolase [Sedimentisphaeraceae bacterium JB056]